ncbi:S-layer homology domain-containing protein [Aeromicrobium sp. Sec7.5]|uniref:S-layer homology domain-containing protein n=1 Tax=Aeromicrobium sp. Sec7.5 TaxID=3121276 RepID=UPI002FE4549D
MIGRLNVSGVVLLCAVLLGVLPAGSASGIDAATAYTPSPTSPFVDVPGPSSGRQHTFYREISWLAERGITTGYTSPPARRFDPSAPVLREQMAAFLYRLAGEPDVTLPSESPFADVPTTHAFYRAIVWLQSTQVTTGYTGTDGTVTFRGGQPVLREQMAAFLYRFWTWQDDGAKPPVPTGATSSFTDVFTGETFEREIRWLATTEVTTGYAEPGGTRTFRGTQSVLREQMAAFMFRFDHAVRTSFAGTDGAVAMSTDGRLVLFTSTRTDLVPGDTNQASDVFVRDTWTGRTERVSVSSTGVQGNTDVSRYGAPHMSADGRFVTFASPASNLVPGDVNAREDIFLHDRTTGVTELVSVKSNEEQSPSDSSLFGSVVSDDGRYVAFHSLADLLPPDTNRSGAGNNVYVRDRQAGVTELASVSTVGQPAGHQQVSQFDMSADGRYVAFVTQAAHVVPGDTNEADDVFVRDRTTGVTKRVSVSTGGAQTPAYGGQSGEVAISDSGLVVFGSTGANLVPGDTNADSDLFTHDIRTGVTARLAPATPGQPGGSAGGFAPAISDDGRYVMFTSYRPNLVAGDTNNREDVFVHDRRTGVTERVSVTTAGAQGNGRHGGGAISGDGRFVSIGTTDSPLVPGLETPYDSTFLRDRGDV